MSKNKLHETIPLSKHGEFDRMAVPGGWLYRVWNLRSLDENDTGYAALCFVPSARAPHVRDDRRLKLRERWKTKARENICVYYCPEDVADPHPNVAMSEDRLARSFTAYHADGSETDHATRLEAHDALIRSGSESPFEVVTGPAVKAEEVKA